jgi:hypothetical protein
MHIHVGLISVMMAFPFFLNAKGLRHHVDFLSQFNFSAPRGSKYSSHRARWTRG